MSDYQAMRTERVDIDPVNLCVGCPKREGCVGVAKVAIDTYVKVSFFSFTVPEGDPEAFASRQYVDDNGATTSMFFEQNEDLIKNCEGPQRMRRTRFGRKVLVCAAHKVTTDDIHRRMAQENARWSEERKNTVYLTPKETEELMALPPEEAVGLVKLPAGELDKLILFAREHPEDVEALKSLAL